MTRIPSLLEMLKAGMHFGHQSSRWHPKMKPYIFGLRGGVHVINLESTAAELEKAAEFVKTLASKGNVVLFVGTKKQAQNLVKEAAERCGMPYLTERWIGGLLTNFDEAKQRLKKYNRIKQEVASGEIERYTKKEQGQIKKELAKMDKYLSGLTNMEKMPDALYIADMRVSKTAVAEAQRKNVPIVGVCDTNVNPENAVYPIPANDDSVNSIKIIVNVLADAILVGKEQWEKEKVVLEKENKKVASNIVMEDKKLAGKSSLVKAVAKKEVRAMKVAESV